MRQAVPRRGGAAVRRRSDGGVRWWWFDEVAGAAVVRQCQWPGRRPSRLTSSVIRVCGSSVASACAPEPLAPELVGRPPRSILLGGREGG